MSDEPGSAETDDEGAGAPPDEGDSRTDGTDESRDLGTDESQDLGADESQDLGADEARDESPDAREESADGEPTDGAGPDGHHPETGGPIRSPSDEQSSAPSADQSTDTTADQSTDTTTDQSTDTTTDQSTTSADRSPPPSDVPPDVRKYERFKKMDGAQYERVNEFLRDRTYITAREWAIARLCADFRTETGVEMTKIGENLPELVPFMTDTYTPQAVNQARSAFEEKVTKSGATFLYGAMCGFFTAEELDDVMYEVTEVAKFLLEVEGVDLAVDEELDAEDRISSVMREVRQSSQELRGDEVRCPECGHIHESQG